MAAIDQEDPCEREERPFQALKDQIANLSLQKGDNDSEGNSEATADDGLKVVEKIESLCMSCEENVQTFQSCYSSIRMLKAVGGNQTSSHQDPVFP